MEKICGIYKITNKINDKCYIGKSVDIYQRWNSHRSDSRPVEDGGDTYTIHCAIRKYGFKNFSFEIIEKCIPEQLEEKEKFWIKYYNSYETGYNETYGGDGSLKYDYYNIYKLWERGLTNKEICEKLKCSDQTVTKAFRLYDISEEEVRSRSNHSQKKAIVAIDILTKKPLKIFPSVRECCMFFHKDLKQIGGLHKSLHNPYRWEGYRWEYLNEYNHPQEELTDEEFFSFKQEKLFIKSKEMKERISKTNRMVERCSRDELKKLIRTMPFTKIGEKFGVTDNAIRKWCDGYDLPRRVKDIKAISDEDWINI